MTTSSKLLIALLITFLLTSNALANELVVSDCKWAKVNYDSKKFIRVIRKAGADYPINYLCWERSKVKGNIFFSLENCLLAVSDEGGIDCNLCENGFHIQAGACVKPPVVPSSSGSSGPISK
jgi:hypothetical protein